MTRLAGLTLSGLIWGAAACGAVSLGDPAVFDWTLGTWEGSRRDAADGTEAPMTMRVDPLLCGAGQIRTLEVRTADGGVYRGVAVQQLDRESGRWLWSYTNSVHRPPARYEGEVRGTRSVWRSITPGRRRESRLVSELLSDGVWRRTMSISTDGGAMWRDLWIDELRRSE